MLLIDLVLQGVRRFSQSQRIPFKPGFNLVFGGNESGKTTLFECIIELLFPNRLIDLKKDWKTWKSEGQSRAGLTLQQGDCFYRLLKDFNQNLITLSRKGPGQEKFERLSSEPSEISALLAEELGLLSYQDYRTLFLESRFWLPSYVGLEKASPSVVESTPEPEPSREEEFAERIKKSGFVDFGAGGFPGMGAPGFGEPGMMGISGPGYAGMPGMPGFPGIPGVPGLGMPGSELLGEDDGLTVEDKQKRLEELKRELEKIKQIEEIQFEIDGINSKIFELEKEKSKLKKFDEELAELDKELEKYRVFRNLPENIDQRIAQYDSLEENRAKTIESLDEKMVAIDEELRYYQAKPKFYQQVFFKIGVGLIGAGILSLVLRGFLPFGFLQWLGILMAPGLLLVGYSLWQFLSDESKRADLREQLKRLEDQKRSVVKEYQVKGAIVKRLLDQTDCESTRELKEMLETFRSLENKRNEIHRKKRELMLELDLDRLNREQEELKSKIPPLEEKLRGFGVPGMERGELMREIARLENALARAQQLGLIKPSAKETPAQVSTSGPVPDVGKTQIVAEVRRENLPFWEQILESGARLFGIGQKEMLAQILGRANLYLQTLSSKRYLEFRQEGDQILVKLADLDHEQELSQLGKTATNLVYFSLKFALLELAVQKYQFPILLDDPYLVLDETKFLTVAKTLKRLSAKTQVIIFSSQKVFAQEADQALSLS